MDRRFGQIALLALSACAPKGPPDSGDRGGVDAGRRVPLPTVVVAMPDAAPLELPPSAPVELITGAAAEQAIADSPAPPSEVRPPDVPELLITPLGVGPYPLGLPRRELFRRVGKAARSVRLRTPPGEPSVEYVELAPLRFKLYAGRLTEIEIQSRDIRAVTDGHLAVGATFEEVILAHGDPRSVPRGWVMSALPGVIFAPTEPTLLRARTPPEAARVGAIVVTGPEVD